MSAKRSRDSSSRLSLPGIGAFPRGIDLVFFTAMLLFGMQTKAEVKHNKQTIVQAQAQELNSLVLEVMRVVSPELLSDSLSATPLHSVKCGFWLASQIRTHLHQFSSEQRLLLAKFSDRPNLPFYYISPRGFFKIHYDLTGTDAVSAADTDGNGVPDYVDEAAKSLEYAYHVEVDSLGFRPPPTDGPEYDIYIRNIVGDYGFIYPDKIIYDPSHDVYVYTSYMEVDNNYDETDTKGLDGLRVTIAHEFFHMVQLGYNPRTNEYGDLVDQFLMEAASTWMEDVVYDGINDYYYYMDYFFSENNMRFDTFDRRREYGLCLWFHFLQRRLGNLIFARQIWEKLYTAKAVEANDLALKQYYGTTFSDELGLFYAWNYRTGSRADTIHFYPEGNAYPEIKLNGSFSLDQKTGLDTVVTTTGVQYYQFQDLSGDHYTFVLTNVRRTEADESDPISLNLSEYRQSSYTQIDDSWYAHTASAQAVNWRNYAFAKKPGDVYSMIKLEETPPIAGKADSLAVWPNPFVFGKDDFVKIPFLLKGKAVVWLYVFSSSGYKVFETSDYFQEYSERKFKWFGKDSDNHPVAGGIYVCVIVSDGGLIRRGKIAVVR